MMTRRNTVLCGALGVMLLLSVVSANKVTDAEADRQWLFEWLQEQHLSSENKARSIVAIKQSYLNTALSKDWIACAEDHGFDPHMEAMRFPPGYKLLFLGNYMIRQVAEAVMMAVPEEDIESYRFLYMTQEEVGQMLQRQGRSESDFGKCPCPISKQRGGYRYGCPIQEMIPGDATEALQKPPTVEGGTAICNGEQTDKSVAFCRDDVAAIRLRNGGIVAQLSNVPAHADQLKDLVESLFNTSLSRFDAVVANAGDNEQLFHAQCGSLAYPSPADWQKIQDQGRLRRGIIDPTAMVKTLKAAGFKGRILYSGRYMGPADVEEEDVAAWGMAATDYGLASEFIPLRSEEEFPEQKECGFATKKGGRQSVFPGPYMMFPAFLQKKLDQVMEAPAATKFVTRFMEAPGGRKDPTKMAATSAYRGFRG